MLQQKALAFGCISLGLFLIGTAINSLRTGVTLSGRGGPGGPIRRDERPAQFWFYFIVRITLGPIAVAAGWFFLI